MSPEPVSRRKFLRIAGIDLGLAPFVIFVGTFVTISLVAFYMLSMLNRSTSDSREAGGAAFEMNPSE